MKCFLEEQLRKYLPLVVKLSEFDTKCNVGSVFNLGELGFSTGFDGIDSFEILLETSCF